MSSELLEIRKFFRSLDKQKEYKFPKCRQELLAPKKRGVYVLMNSRGSVEHVGSTPRGKHGIQQRLKDHLSGRSSFTKSRFSGNGSKLRKGYKYKYLEVRSSRKRALLEAYATAHLCPKHIGLG